MSSSDGGIIARRHARPQRSAILDRNNSFSDITALKKPPPIKHNRNEEPSPPIARTQSLSIRTKHRESEGISDNSTTKPSSIAPAFMKQGNRIPIKVRQTPSWISHQARSSKFAVPKTRLWTEFVTHGLLEQGASKYIICTDKQDFTTAMFKEVTIEPDLHSSLNHRDLLACKHVIIEERKVYHGFDYSPFTLREILNISARIEEVHVRAIATCVFNAVKYLHGEKKVAHGGVTTSAIRFDRASCKPILGECDRVQSQTRNRRMKDFEDFGLLLLECMEPGRETRTAEDVRQSRAQGKMFGLEQPEPWESFKDLIDFIERLFDQQVSPEDKIKAVNITAALERLASALILGFSSIRT